MKKFNLILILFAIISRVVKMMMNVTNYALHHHKHFNLKLSIKKVEKIYLQTERLTQMTSQ